MKYLKLSLIKKIVLIFAVIFLPLFLLAGIAVQRLFTSQVSENSKNYVRALAVDESYDIDDYMAQREALGQKSVDFIKKKLEHTPTSVELEDFDRKYRIIDGTLRTDLNAFSSDYISAIFLSNRTELSDDIKRIIIATEGCFDDYAKGVKSKVFNMYLITKHQLIRIYEKNWSLEIEPDHDFTKDSFYYIADPVHNPQRIPRWTEIYYDSIWERWMTSLITPVYIDDEFIGIVGHDVILDDIYDEILTKKLFDTGYGFLFDANRNIIVHPRYQEKLHETAKMGAALNSDVLDKGTAEAVSKTIQLNSSKMNNAVIEYTEATGQTNYFFACKLNSVNWYYGVVVPKNEILKLLPAFQKKLLCSAPVFGIIVFGVIVLATWFYVLRPIVKISKATKELGGGNLDYKISFGTNDEFGDLARSFNTMASNLKSITASKNELDREIGARKLMEKELWEARDHYESLINNTSIGIAIMDTNHKIIRVNPVFASLFKKPLESFVGKHCFREFEKREEICPHCPGVKAIVSGKTEEVETEGVRDDGTHFNVRIRAIPFFGSKNEITGFIEMVEDITERKRTEEQLRESEEKYRRQFEGAMDAIFLADCQTGNLVDCNRAALKLVGREKTELIGHHQKILHPADVFDGEFTNSFNEHLKGCEGTVLETRVITKTGEIRNVAIKASVLEIGGKKVLQGIFRDITENKQKERKLREIQDELVETSRRAGMAEVAADVLHNVGNVLNSINVSTTLINETLSNSEIPNLKKVTDMVEEQLGDLGKFFTDDPKGRYIPSYLIKAVKLLTHEQTDVMGKLEALIEDVNHIKTIIKMQQEYTKVSGVEVTTAIDRIIEDAIRINQAGLKRHKIRIVRDYAELGEVNIDKQRVIQILINLIGNAKYALAGSSAIDKILTIRSCKRDDGYLRIEVADNGVGIAKENLTKIFQHGFTTKKDGHGFGLHSGALAAKEMNGSLTVHSDGLGQGATFTLELPFKPAGATQWTTQQAQLTDVF